MQWIQPFSSIFFDFDGLLVDTEPLHFEAYQKMLKKNGVELSWNFDLFLSIAHQGSGGLRAHLFSQAPQLFSSKTWETLYEEKKTNYLALLEIKEIDWMPGAQSMVAMVQGVGLPHAVVTNSTKRETLLICEKIPALKEIPQWITREHYKHPKPAPDAYLKALDSVGPLGRSVGFEDTLKGTRALQQAGITPVLICSMHHPQMGQALKSLYYAPSFVSFLKDPFTRLSQNTP